MSDVRDDSRKPSARVQTMGPRLLSSREDRVSEIAQRVSCRGRSRMMGPFLCTVTSEKTSVLTVEVPLPYFTVCLCPAREADEWGSLCLVGFPLWSFHYCTDQKLLVRVGEPDSEKLIPNLLNQKRKTAVTSRKKVIGTKPTTSHFWIPSLFRLPSPPPQKKTKQNRARAGCRITGVGSKAT